MDHKLSYRAKLEHVCSYVVDNYVEVEDVVNWLGVTIEDVMLVFQDKLVERYEEVVQREDDDSLYEETDQDEGADGIGKDFEESGY
jgi:hypothetical protein